MFYHLEGTVSEIQPNLTVIDCGGVGFAVNITGATAGTLRMGEKRRLYIAEAITESSFDLYGFATKGEKSCYEMLISVSGVGPKAALSILSCNSPEGLALAVMNGDEKALTAAPGIGKKIAQRIILELKDKISKELGSVDVPAVSMAVPLTDNSAMGDAMAALTMLGYSSAEVAPVLRKLNVDGMTAENIIKAVLKNMVQ